MTGLTLAFTRKIYFHIIGLGLESVALHVSGLRLGLLAMLTCLLSPNQQCQSSDSIQHNVKGNLHGKFHLDQSICVATRDPCNQLTRGNQPIMQPMKPRQTHLWSCCEKFILINKLLTAINIQIQHQSARFTQQAAPYLHAASSAPEKPSQNIPVPLRLLH